MNTIKNFFFRRRFKPLKNKKGFSLVEVLVAVAIIGIISAIAYPSFKDYRESAASVAANTSAINMAKAFTNCNVLNAFSNCITLADIKITCPAGANCDSGGTGGQWCAHIKKGTSANNDDFNICVSVSPTGTVSTVAGGALLNNKYYCHKEVTGGSGCTTKQDKAADITKKCTTATAVTVCGVATNTVGTGVNACTTANTCEVPTRDGECDTGAGTCS